MSKPVFTTKSTTMHKVDYNEKEKHLDIEFRSGNVYRYADVPPRLWKVFNYILNAKARPVRSLTSTSKDSLTAKK